jgi:hypothetical protein
MYGDYIPKVGDVGFSHNKGLMPKLIRLGEWLKFRDCEYNHEFVISRIDENGVAYVTQSTFRWHLKGVTNTATLESVAPGGTFTIVTPPPEVDIDKFLEFCESQVGIKYSNITILAISVDILSWSWVPSFMNAHRPSWICSGLINEGLRFGGWLHQWVNIYTIMPQAGHDALAAQECIVRKFAADLEWPHTYKLIEG